MRPPARICLTTADKTPLPLSIINYDTMEWYYQDQVERKMDGIRRMALAKAQAINPAATFVVDHYSFDDYCDKRWDYPGAWYCFFKLPNDVRTESELIDKIAHETIDYFSIH